MFRIFLIVYQLDYLQHDHLVGIVEHGATSAIPPRPIPHHIEAGVPNQQKSHPASAADNDSAPLLHMDPVIPPINAYGTFDTTGFLSSGHALTSTSSSASMASTTSSHKALRPSAQPRGDSFTGNILSELIPFFGFLDLAIRVFRGESPLEIVPPGVPVCSLPHKSQIC